MAAVYTLCAVAYLCAAALIAYWLGCYTGESLDDSDHPWLSIAGLLLWPVSLTVGLFAGGMLAASVAGVRSRKGSRQ